MKLIVWDRVSGKRHELEIFEETTAQDVIDALIGEGLIRSYYGELFDEWILIDSKYVRIHPNERIVPRISSNGKNEVYLFHLVGNYYEPTYMSGLE
jgi:hypothetical protein